jgi:acyl-CoA thioesterase FadM
VQFADTDMAGVVHFSWIANYMEEAEHALWRAAGLSIAPADAVLAFPRVALSIDFSAPLHFEEEFEGPRAHRRHLKRVRFATRTPSRAANTVIATGTMTAACVRKLPAPMRAVEIPAQHPRAPRHLQLDAGLVL